MEYNVNDFTLSELMEIIGVQQMDPKEIREKTKQLTAKVQQFNPELAVFFQAVQSQLLQYAQGLREKPVVEGFTNGLDEDAIYPSGEKQVSDWYHNEYLTQSDANQSDKITQRKQKIQLFNNPAVPMNREQLATTDTYSLPVKQDTLNPNLKNTITRFVNLDSQFRQYSNGPESLSTDYTLDLSDILKDVISMRVYSYQIPYSWYTIDVNYGNTCFWVLMNGGLNGDLVQDLDGDLDTISAAITIPPGNYSPTAFMDALNQAFTRKGFTLSGNDAFITYNESNGKLTFHLFGATYTDAENPGIICTVDETSQLLFYDFEQQYLCTNNCFSKSNHFLNTSLGWLMGFRLSYIHVSMLGNEAPAILNLTGTKYVMLVVDDYNQNHVNNSLVSISQYTNTIKRPSYMTPDQPYECNVVPPGENNLQELIAEAKLSSILNAQTPNTKNGLLIGGKYKESYWNVPTYVPSAPRKLTNAQLYTINQINNDRNQINYLVSAPTSPDILAVFPIKQGLTLQTSELIVEMTGSLQDNIRTYFGPVNIERLSIKLLNDKGNVLNLNGNDWCVTLICECLYQY